MKGRPSAFTRYRTFLLGLFVIFLIQALPAQISQSEQQKIDRIIGAKGAYIPDEGVYKFTLPREAATVVFDYQTLPATMGLNSWAAFSSAQHHGALLTGQLLLLENEVDAVVAAALKSHLEVTGLADSSFFDGPSMKTVDIAGVGTFEQLAGGLRSVLAEIHRVSTERSLRETLQRRPTVSLDSSITPAPIDQILSMHGILSNGVYRATIGRRGTIYGEEAGREMGLSTWISISGTDSEALAHGEIIAVGNELQIVLRALGARGFRRISIRNHMIAEHPEYFYIKCWREGPSADSAQAFRYVLDEQIGATSSARAAH